MDTRRAAVRCIVLLSFAALPAVMLASFSIAQNPVLAAKKYKNIKVLKKLPADQMIPVMHKISESLGVKCDFCHAVKTDSRGQHTGWEIDSKPMKSMARKMILMTEGINKRFTVVEKKVTCFTCHNGHAEPAGMPPARPRR